MNLQCVVGKTTKLSPSLACLRDYRVQGGPAEAAGYSPNEGTLQRFWEHCEDILSRAAAEVPEASLDADSQAQRLQHAKLEQVLPALLTSSGGVCVCLCVCVSVC